MNGRYPGAEWKPVGSHGGAMSAQLGLIEHITTNDFSPYGFFSNPNNKASSHFWIAKNGKIEQYIDLANYSWAQASGNYTYTSCEIAGQEGTAKTPEQVTSLAELYLWGHNNPDLAWPLQLANGAGQKGLGYHAMGGTSWGHQFCPGAVRLAERPLVLSRIISLAGNPVERKRMDLYRPESSQAVYQAVGSHLEHISKEAFLARKLNHADVQVLPDTDPLFALVKVSAVLV